MVPTGRPFPPHKGPGSGEPLTSGAGTPSPPDSLTPHVGHKTVVHPDRSPLVPLLERRRVATQGVAVRPGTSTSGKRTTS